MATLQNIGRIGVATVRLFDFRFLPLTENGRLKPGRFTALPARLQMKLLACWSARCCSTCFRGIVGLGRARSGWVGGAFSASFSEMETFVTGSSRAVSNRSASLPCCEYSDGSVCRVYACVVILYGPLWQAEVALSRLPMICVHGMFLPLFCCAQTHFCCLCVLLFYGRHDPKRLSGLQARPLSLTDLTPGRRCPSPSSFYVGMSVLE